MRQFSLLSVGREGLRDEEARMKRTAALAILLLSIGCSRDQRPTQQPATARMPAPERARPETVPASFRMIIRTASISLVVEDARDSLRSIVAAVEHQGGYVVESRQWRENGQVRATATLRIPAARLFDVLPEIRR